MKSAFLAVLFSIVLASGEPLFVVEGGISPKNRFAVVVVPQKEGEFIDEADDAVYLIDAKTKKTLHRFEDLSSSGGTWGTTTTNVRADWSPDGRYLIVNHRIGRLMHSHQLYRIKNQSVIPLSPKRRNLTPKSKILDVLGYSANPGATLRWDSDGTLVESVYGYMPRKGHFEEDYSVYGLSDFDGSLEFRYRHSHRGSWELFDIQTPKDK